MEKLLICSSKPSTVSAVLVVAWMTAAMNVTILLLLLSYCSSSFVSEDVVMEHFSDCSKYQIDVILLRRWLPATLQSRVLLGHFADRPHHGIKENHTF